ncbi:MAG: response regulator [Lewinella sp.]|nr:response regulator [Lewinella sp.]
MNTRLLLLFLLGILFRPLHAADFEQDSLANFWSAVLPEATPYDPLQLEECLKKIAALPVRAVDLQPAAICDLEGHLDGDVLARKPYWLEKVAEYRRKGLKDCSNLILNRLLAAAKGNAADELDISIEQISNCLYFFEYRTADSLAARLQEMEKRLPGDHPRARYIVAFTSYRNRRPEQARVQVGEALAAAQETGDTTLQINALSLIGFINRDVFLGPSLKAVPYHQKALALARITRDTAIIIRELVSISLNYIDAGQMDLHFDYLNKALDYLKDFEESSQYIRIRTVICNSLIKLGRAEEAEKMMLESIRYADACRTAYTGQLYSHLAWLYIDTKQFGKARAPMEKSRAIIMKTGGTEPEMVALHESFYALAKANGQTGMALKELEKAYEMTSLMYTQKNTALLSRLETQYRTGEKEKLLQEKEMLLQEKESLLETTQTQRTLLFVFSALITLLGVAILIGFLKQRKARHQLARQNETILQQTEALKSLEQLKSRFFANVSHELRTPLTLMLGPVGSLLKRGHWQEADLNLLQIVRRNGDHLLKLVNEILDLSKLETGRLEVVETPVNFYRFLQPIVAQFSSFNDSEPFKLLFNYQADTGLRLRLDTGKFEKIAYNFLSNATKFTPAGGVIELRVEDMGDQLLIRVSDTGPGIHPDDLPYIFDRFYQSRQPGVQAQGGTGIGLSLCRELAGLLEGEVWAESVYGSGSTFYFRFPKREATGNATLHNEPEEAPGLPTESPSYPKEPELLPGPNRQSRSSNGKEPAILIVEDNPDLRKYMESVLAPIYRVRTADNGKAALQLLLEPGSEPVDLIISDLMMPVMDGFQLLETVKSKDRLRHIPFIMLTARADIRVKLRALRIGVDDYLTKPFQEEELLARIENLLHNYRERLALFSAADQLQKPDIAIHKPVISKVDAEWLETVEQLFLTQMADGSLNMDFTAGKLNLSTRHFSRRLKQLTGMTPNHYLQEMRLQKACELLQAGRYATVKEVCYAVGFNDTRYFSDLFEKRFGARPSGI